MSEIGLAEIFSMAEAAALVATLFVILYFSRKQAQSLSVDIETKVLNDLEERRQVITQMAFEHPEVIKVVTKSESHWSLEDIFAYNTFYTYAHVFHMRQRKVLNDNEWTGWLRIMKSAFEQGTLGEMWESKIEMEKWFDPAFQEFVNKELASRK